MGKKKLSDSRAKTPQRPRESTAPSDSSSSPLPASQASASSPLALSPILPRASRSRNHLSRSQARRVPTLPAPRDSSEWRTWTTPSPSPTTTTWSAARWEARVARQSRKLPLPPRSSRSASSVSSRDPSWRRTRSAATAPTVRQNQYLIGFQFIVVQFGC